MTAHLRLLMICVLALQSRLAYAEAVISWASDPVAPDETVLLRGHGFGAKPTVSFARLEDGDALAAGPGTRAWVTLPALQAVDDALKFVIPSSTRPGVFLCRVIVDGGTSAPVFLNRPSVWWMQGDGGPSATPGGWLRIFGTCLGIDPAAVHVQLVAAGEATTALRAEASDGWSLRVQLPMELAPGSYAVRVHNGAGGADAWCQAGAFSITSSTPWPTTVFNVLEGCGPDAQRDMRRTLTKYGQPVDHTKDVAAALAKAKANGGGTVFFPAGRYHLASRLDIPPHTLLKGEGMGLVTLWWGGGKFNLDGGGDQGLAKQADPEPPASLISGPSFGIEALSIYLPLDHHTGIDGFGELRLHQVRVRVDHLWAIDGDKRPEGFVARLGHHFEVIDCDIIAKGVGLAPGEFGVISHNRILAGKSPCPLGDCRGLIVEDNDFVSTFPTAYQNIAGVGQDLYYARNRHEALSAHQADFSFTFDAGGSAYHGALAAVDGPTLTLAGDPQFPTWANERSGLWRRAVVCVVSGTGSGQWRSVRSFSARSWTLSEPFLVPPDSGSVITIVPLCGRSLIIANRFEDANWVNAGFGCALDVIYADNHLVRCAQMLDYGLASPKALLPNFNVQCFGNELSEGLGSIEVNGSVRPAESFAGQITQNVIHRRERLTADNSGGIMIQGAVREVIVEGCSAAHPSSSIRVNPGPIGVLIRHCRSATGDLTCEGAVPVP